MTRGRAPIMVDSPLRGICTRARAWLAAALVLLAAGGAWAQATCPPPPATPSAEQWRTLQRDARDRGLLWRLSKDGRAAWLFATIHVGKPAWSVPGPTLRRALAQSDVVALEIDPDDPRLAAQLHEASRAAPQPDAALRQRLQAQVVAACMPADALQGLHPMLQVVTLTLLAARQDELDAAFAQELMLAAAARASGLRVVALERVEQQIGALLPADATQMRMLLDEGLDQLERGQARPVLRKLAGAWAAGDLTALEQYASWCECADGAEQRAWLRRVNDDRNAHLAAGIDALHAQGHQVFAAVGALHMTGPQALPRLLEQRGYSVQRVPF
jgi:uncharacterized protein YbaP (TraB family)